MQRAFFSARNGARASCILAFITVAGAACAADSSHAVTIDLGSIVMPLASVISAAASTIIAGLFARYAGPVARLGVTDQLLKRAVDYGVATVAGAAKGKEISIPVANDVLRAAAQYAAANAPKLTLELGETLMPKLIARLGSAVQLPPETAARNLTGA